MLIDVIIPNWNGKRYLQDCLDSLRRQIYQSFRVIIVDNGSTDDSVEFIRGHYPEVTLIALTENKGFAGGVNEGIRPSDAELIFLLNNDTVVDPNCLRELSGAAAKYPDISYFATKMLFRNSPGVINAAGDSFGIDGQARNIGFRDFDDGRYDQVAEVFGACAGAALYRKSFFKDVGLFDEDFFLIMEDVDIEFRGQLKGHRCFYIPTAVVHHIHSASIVKHSPLQIYHGARNALFVLVKDMPSKLLLKYSRKIIRQRSRMLLDSIFQDQTRPWIEAEFAFLRNAFAMAIKRMSIQRARRVTTEYVNSILLDPEARG
jgi:GT2 family glycosyltransferase